MEHPRAIPSGGGACEIIVMTVVCYVNGVHGVLLCPLLKNEIRLDLPIGVEPTNSSTGSRACFLDFPLIRDTHLINTRDPLFCFIRERNFQRGTSTDYRRRSGLNKGGVPSARVCLSRVRKLTRIGHHTARCPYISPRIFEGWYYLRVIQHKKNEPSTGL